MDRVLNLKNVAGIEAFSSRYAQLGDLYILSHLRTGEQREIDAAVEIDTPGLLSDSNRLLRLNGLLFLQVESGTINMQVNTQTYSVASGDIVVVRPGTLISFDEIESPVEITLLFISTTFLNSISIDLNSVDMRSIMSRPRSVMTLTQGENEIIKKYLDLLDVNAADPSGSVFAKRVARSLISAISYELLRFANRAPVEKTDENTGERAVGRAQSYVYRFMQLLQVHYAVERNLDFYARQLCITSKYLTMVTKEVTGVTASEWMNRVVILEAKNMLRFSGKSIQQVAYALNFPSQSAFGKYFKRITGESPSAFLKSV